MIPHRNRLLAALAAPVLLAVSAAPALAHPGHAEAIAAALANPDRPKEDVARDAYRQPAALLMFAHVKAGDQVADLIAGGGYFTRLFSALAGPKGHVYAMVPAELAAKWPKSKPGNDALAADPHMQNVSALYPEIAKLAADKPLDLVFTAQNYHDVICYLSVADTMAMNKAIFAALKPGGHFVVIDHAGPGVTDPAEIKRLHRVDEALVKSQILAAGFVLDKESDVLRNKADMHDKMVFDPAIRSHTDQFVLSFKKPG